MFVGSGTGAGFGSVLVLIVINWEETSERPNEGGRIDGADFVP